VPAFFASLADFEFVRFEPFAFLEGDNTVAVPVRLELVHRATGKRIRDLEMHLWTFAPDGQIAGFRHFVETLQWALASGAWVAAGPIAGKPSKATVRFGEALDVRNWDVPWRIGHDSSWPNSGFGLLPVT